AVVTVALVAAACGGGHRVSAGRRPPPAPPGPAPSAAAVTMPASPLVPGANVYAGTMTTTLGPAVAGMRERVYVPNSAGNTLDVIDPTTYRVIDHIAV